MIRHSVQSGVGRSRQELSRLSEGIASSLRQFSTAQTQCAAEDGTPSRPASSRQRSAAAANELLSMNDDAKPQTNNRSQTPETAAPRVANRQIPTVISVNTLRGDTPGQGQRLFTGFRKVGGDNEFRPSDPSGSSSLGGGIVTGNIIRGGFRGRGRGGGSFAGRGGGSFAGRGGGSFAGRGGGSFANRSDGRSGSVDGRGGRGRGRGRGGRGRGSDDRPARGPKFTKREKELEAEYQRFKSAGGVVEPELAAYHETQECGVEKPYQPTAPKDLFAELAAYAPTMATNASPLARASTIISQVVALGGGHPLHPEEVSRPKEAKRMDYASHPNETLATVLDSTLLGKYNGPQYAQLNDTLRTVRSYAKRDGTWHAQAETNIEAKVKSLLPVAKAKGAQAKQKPKTA